MEIEAMGLFARLWLALVLPWRLLIDGVLAARVRGALTGPGPEPEPPAPAPEPPAPELVEPEVVPGADPTTALQLLGILQREGRFVDFLQEDVTDFSDADIGAAARVVHAGCRRGLGDYLEVRPVRSEAEGDPIALEPGFDATRVRVTGNVAGEPPYHGHLAHHGWEVAEIRLPTLTEGHDPRVVAPAEVELQA